MSEEPEYVKRVRIKRMQLKKMNKNQAQKFQIIFQGEGIRKLQMKGLNAQKIRNPQKKKGCCRIRQLINCPVALLLRCLRTHKLKPIQEQEAKKKNEIKVFYIQFISKICGGLFLNRETFELAQIYFMRNMGSFLNQQRKIQTLAIVCIILALKIDDSLMAKPLFREIIANPNIKFAYQSKESKNSISKSKQKSREKKQAQKQQQSRQEFLKRLMLVKKRTAHRSVSYLKKLQNIFQIYQIETPKRQQLVSMQKFICQELKFKLSYKTLSYSIDYLTFRWDDYILNKYEEKYCFLMFRDAMEKRKFSYLIQISDLYILDEFEDSYKNIFVLTIIYLLVRVQLQSVSRNTKVGLNSIRESLRQSTNILYVDSVGVNLIFTNFLEEIGFKMESIAQFCSSILKYLEQQLFQVFSFDQEKAFNHEETLALHNHNPKLYRFFNDSINRE